MQESYNEAHAKIKIDHLSEQEAVRRISAEASEVPKTDVQYGDDGYVYP
jgi:hypothetical protein